MKNLKSPHFLILCASFVLLSCKKEKKPNVEITELVVPNPTENEEPDTEGTEPYPIEKGMYVPSKLEGSGLTLSFKYKANTALLAEISDGNNNRTVISYTASQLPQKLEKYSNGKLFYIVYYEQADKKTTNKALTFTHKEKPTNSTPTGSYTLTYNDQQKISSINYYNNSNNLINTTSLSYTESLSLSEMVTTAPINTTAYTFDNKDGITSHIPFSDLFALEVDYWFLLCNGNNLLTIRNQKAPEQNINISFEYNENDYPSSATLTNDKSSETVKITYERLE